MIVVVKEKPKYTGQCPFHFVDSYGNGRCNLSDYDNRGRRQACESAYECEHLISFDECLNKEPKKVTLKNDFFRCPTCNGIQAMNVHNFCVECQNEYCGKCGQRLDWNINFVRW